MEIVSHRQKVENATTNSTLRTRCGDGWGCGCSTLHCLNVALFDAVAVATVVLLITCCCELFIVVFQISAKTFAGSANFLAGTR
jgi:hypothetical protein